MSSGVERGITERSVHYVYGLLTLRIMTPIKYKSHPDKRCYELAYHAMPGQEEERHNAAMACQ